MDGSNSDQGHKCVNCEKPSIYRAFQDYRNHETGGVTEQVIYFCEQHWAECWGSKASQ